MIPLESHLGGGSESGTASRMLGARNNVVTSLIVESAPGESISVNSETDRVARHQPFCHAVHAPPFRTAGADAREGSHDAIFCDQTVTTGRAKAPPRCLPSAKHPGIAGGAGRDRTFDRGIMSPLLSPLSYGPVGSIMPAGNRAAEPQRQPAAPGRNEMTRPSLVPTSTWPDEIEGPPVIGAPTSYFHNGSQVAVPHPAAANARITPAVVAV